MTNIKVQGIAEQGGSLVVTSGTDSVTRVGKTFPSATVTVYNTGTVTLSSIFSDSGGTPKANPFTAGSDASWSFYIASGHYDIKFSGTGIDSPFTIADVVATDVASASGVTTFNTRVGTVAPATNDYTWAQVNKSTSALQDVTTRLKLSTGTLYDSYGDSITLGNQVGVTTPFRTLLSSCNGMTNTNHAVSGDQAADQSLIAVNKAISDTTDQRFTLMIGYNDQRLYGTSAAKRGFFRRYAAATMAWLAIPDNRKFTGRDTTNIAYVGAGWADDAVIGRRSGTAAETATFTATGRTIYIASLLHDNAGAGTATITIDGVNCGTLTSKATGAFTLNGCSYAPALYRFSGLADTAHTVVLTMDGTGFFYVEWVAGNSGLPLLHGPHLWVGGITRGSTAAYGASGGSDVLVGQYNDELVNAIAELNDDGLPVTYVETAFLNPTTETIDGIHPTDAGHVKLANAFESKMNGIADPSIRSIKGAPSFIAPTLLNSWVDYGGAVEASGFAKTPDGVVRLKGTIKNGTLTASAFLLPTGFRPAANRLYPVVSNSVFGYITIQSDGNVVMSSVNATFVTLDGISFVASNG